MSKWTLILLSSLILVACDAAKKPTANPTAGANQGQTTPALLPPAGNSNDIRVIRRDITDRALDYARNPSPTTSNSAEDSTETKEAKEPEPVAEAPKTERDSSRAPRGAGFSQRTSSTRQEPSRDQPAATAVAEETAIPQDPAPRPTIQPEPVAVKPVPAQKPDKPEPEKPPEPITEITLSQVVNLQQLFAEPIPNSGTDDAQAYVVKIKYRTDEKAESIAILEVIFSHSKNPKRQLGSFDRNPNSDDSKSRADSFIVRLQQGSKQSNGQNRINFSDLDNVRIIGD